MEGPHERYRVLRQVGQGGMGRLLLAWDEALQREVALKLMEAPDELALRARFAREAQLLARFRSSRFPEVYDYDVAATPPWMAMEWVEGRNLEEDPPADPIAVMTEVLEGLRELHAAGVMHRDVKPANIVRTEAGRVALVDFGLAWSPDVQQLTGSGVVVGTPAYMAPELLRRGVASPASDLYAWAVALYTLIEGAPPFGRTLEEIGGRPDRRHVEFRVLPPGDPLRRLLRRCLDRNPERRPAGAAEVLRALRRRQDGVEEATTEPTGLYVRRTQVLESSSRGGVPPQGGASTPRRGSRTDRRRGASAPRRAARAWRRGLATLGGTAVLAGLVAGWLRGTSPALPDPPEVARPAPTRDPAKGPDLDLAAELRRAMDPDRPHPPGFRAEYLAVGGEAFERLPGHAAWTRWAEDHGDLRDLDGVALARLQAADAQAEALGLLPPFGPGWDPANAAAVDEDPRAWLARAMREAGACRVALEDLAANRTDEFPGVQVTPHLLLSAKAQLTILLEGTADDFASARTRDRLLRPLRQIWRRLAACGGRAIERLDPAEVDGAVVSMDRALRGFRHSMYGAASGLRVRRVLGFRPRTAGGVAYQDKVADALVRLIPARRRQAAAEAREDEG